MTHYANGAKFEYLVRDYFLAKGFFVIRSTGSHGIADLLVWRVGHEEGKILGGSEVQVIQCKKESKRKSYDADLIKLNSLQVPKGWKKRLWVKSGKEIWVHDVTEKKFGIKVRTVSDVKKRIKELQNGKN